MATTVGIRDLKANLSRYLEEVKRGGTIWVTERKRRVAQILPVGLSVEERMTKMQEAGLIAWNGCKLRPRKPVVKNRSKTTVAEILLKNRG